MSVNRGTQSSIMIPVCIRFDFPPPPAHRIGYVLHGMLLVYFLQASALGSALKGRKLGAKPCCEIVTSVFPGAN